MIFKCSIKNLIGRIKSIKKIGIECSTQLPEQKTEEKQDIEKIFKEFDNSTLSGIEDILQNELKEKGINLRKIY